MITAEDEEQLFNDPTLVIRRRKVGKERTAVAVCASCDWGCVRGDVTES